MEIYGPEASGKTTLALHVIAEAQKSGGMAIVPLLVSFYICMVLCFLICFLSRNSGSLFFEDSCWCHKLNGMNIFMINCSTKFRTLECQLLDKLFIFVEL